MDDLRRWYREALRTRIAALETALAADGTVAPDSVEAVRRIAHSLRGSGTTYGYPQISAAARALEEAADDGRLGPAVDALLGVLHEVSGDGADRPHTILVVEDDRETAEAHRGRIESPSRRVRIAATGAEAEEILDLEPVSLVLLDLVLPDTDGRNLLLRIRERPALGAVPIIVLTAHASPQIRTECIMLGADDILELPVDGRRLSAAVTSRLAQAAARARDARLDPVTRLPNRAAFREAYDRAIALVDRDKEVLSLGLLEPDGLGGILETYGSAAVNAAFAHAAVVVGRCLRRSDLLARWSGERMAALFPNTPQEGAARALEKALAALEESPLEIPGGRMLRLGFSAGVTAVWEAAPIDEVVARADHHLYVARTSGGRRVLSAADRVREPRRRILLAEDDELTTALVVHRLNREGFDVVHFPDGAHALAGAAEQPFDLAILDVKMPGLDGFQLLERLRGVSDFAQVPVIMLTSMGREQDIVRGLDLGANDYVVKPFSPVELVARVRRLLKR